MWTMTFHLRLVALVTCAWLAVPGQALQAAETVMFEARSTSGDPIANVVITSGAESAAPATQSAIMDQADKEFRPYVLPVRAGTEVSFPNSDQIRHHVYSFSEPKRFELRLYHGEPGETVTFETPGVVVLGCNIHDNMVGYIYVTGRPHNAVTDASGQARVPVADSRITVWHPALSFDATRRLDLDVADLTAEDGTRIIRLDMPTPPANPQAVDPDATDRFRQFLPD